ncbi:MAG: hypothetical protein J7L43_02480 [Candidatus Aenigmarchaeota archaeon]|nr:hypothetical protein [Candidatus Aenigmarchaeota archaeon]
MLGKNKELYERFMEEGNYGAALDIAMNMGDNEKLYEAGIKAYESCLKDRDIHGTVIYGIKIGFSLDKIESDLYEIFDDEKTRRGIETLIRVLKGSSHE